MLGSIKIYKRNSELRRILVFSILKRMLVFNIIYIFISINFRITITLNYSKKSIILNI